jgi:hypothetical protein
LIDFIEWVFEIEEGVLTVAHGLEKEGTNGMLIGYQLFIVCRVHNDTERKKCIFRGAHK